MILVYIPFVKKIKYCDFLKKLRTNLGWCTLSSSEESSPEEICLQTLKMFLFVLYFTGLHSSGKQRHYFLSVRLFCIPSAFIQIKNQHARLGMCTHMHKMYARSLHFLICLQLKLSSFILSLLIPSYNSTFSAAVFF